MRKALADTLLRRYRATVPPPDHAATLADLKDRVQQCTIQVANKTELEFFGSHSSGFCKPDADADLSFTWRNWNQWHHGISTVDEQTEKKMHRLGGVLAESGFQGVRYVKAKIPVVAFVDSHSSLHCDVTVGNVGGVENSKILRRIRLIHPELIGMYVNTVKEWGKAREVIAPDKGGFNSFTMTTMAVAVLQELGVVPVFHQPTGMLGELTVADAEKAIAAFALPPVYASLSDDTQLGEAMLFLLRSFAMYYSKFDFQKGTVSLIHPRRLRSAYEQVVKQYMQRFRALKREHWEGYHVSHPKDPAFDELAFSGAVHHEESQRPHNSPFVVEDFVNYVNCGRRVKAPRMKSLISEFTRLHDLLSRDDASYDTIFAVSNVHPSVHRSDAHDSRVHTFHSKH